MPAEKTRIAVYFSAPERDGYPLNNADYRTAYLDFFRYGTRIYPDLQFFVVRGKSYLGSSVFSGGEKYDLRSEELKPFDQQIEADLIFNRGDLIVPQKEIGQIDLVNHPELHEICKDKLRSAAVFPEYLPVSVEIHSIEEALAALDLIPSEKVVLKPRAGQEGKGLQFFEKAEISKIPMAEGASVLLQEFFDTSKGIPGLISKAHDLRLVLMNGKLAEAVIRMPAKESYIANVSQGGSLQEIDFADIPPEIVVIAQKIDRRFSSFFPRIYSIDFAYTASGPRIFELNSQPGIPGPDCPKYYRFWQERLLETLLSSFDRNQALRSQEISVLA